MVRYLIVRLSTFVLLAASVILGGHDAAAGTIPFYSQCEKLLPIADDFARDCKDRARPFSRTFYPSGRSLGQPESLSTYFKALDSPSHFVLGCVLDFKHKINFVGLYYSHRLLDMSDFDSYEIVFVDFNDNVGLKIDDVQNTLIAIRQFVTDVIPPRLTGRPKNCEDAGLETIDGINAAAVKGNHFRKIDDQTIEHCLVNSCKIEPVEVFHDTHETPIVFNDYDRFMIDGNGVMIIQKAFFISACTQWRGDSANEYNIIYEMCPQHK